MFSQAIKGYEILATVESMGTVIGTPTHDIRIVGCGVCPPDVELEDDPFDTNIANIEEPPPALELRPDDWPEVSVLRPNTNGQTEQLPTRQSIMKW